MQAAFFKLSKILPLDDAVKYMKDAIRTTYGRKGEKIVNMNIEAVDAGIEQVKEIKVPANWATAKSDPKKAALDGGLAHAKNYVDNILVPVQAMRGDKLPVSAFIDYQTGTVPANSRFEKRGIAVDVPEWIPENCLQVQPVRICLPACGYSSLRAWTQKR